MTWQSMMILSTEYSLTGTKLAQAEKRIGELDRLFVRIYEDNVAGKLDDERFAMMSKNYTEEQKDLKAEVKGLQQQIHEQEQQAENIEQFVQRVKRNSTLAEGSKQKEKEPDRIKPARSTRILTGWDGNLIELIRD